MMRFELDGESRAEVHVQFSRSCLRALLRPDARHTRIEHPVQEVLPMPCASRRAVRLALIALGVSGALAPARTDDRMARTPFDGLRFRDIGPAATGGRIHDIQVDPRNPAVLYVAAATGGIWKSTNK